MADRFVRLLLATAAGLLLACATAAAVQPAAAGGRAVEPAAAKASKPAAGAARAARISTAVRRVMREREIPGVIVGVWQPGRPAYERAFGQRAHASRTPMTTDLYMRIGSETKTFVATAVLQLVEAGRIRLDDPIGRYLKGIPNGDRVTIRQLGEMRSGIASYTSNPSWLAAYLADPMRTWKPRELLASAFSLGPAFAPGSAFEYSNANYIILGLLVEKLSGESLPAYLRRHVLRPLRLRHTSFPLTSAFPTRPATRPRRRPARWPTRPTGAHPPSGPRGR